MESNQPSVTNDTELLEPEKKSEDQKPSSATIMKATIKVYNKHRKPAHQSHKQRRVGAQKRRAKAAHDRKVGTRCHVTPIEISKKYSNGFSESYAIGFDQVERSPRKIGMSNKHCKLYLRNIPMVNLRKKNEEMAEAKKTAKTVLGEKDDIVREE
ncbi:hypothetical protein ACHAQA_008423 [Verticillium albo-atrum]